MVEEEAPAAAAPAAVEEEEGEEELGMEPWIETPRCTSCNECTNLNPKMFAYDENKQAYIKDPKAGTFAQLVQAAERCTPGRPPRLRVLLLPARPGRGGLERRTGAAHDRPGGIDPATGVAGVDLRDAMRRLDPEDRALLTLRYVLGFDATEISAVLGPSPAAVRQRLHRLLARLRQELS